jgi:hypothetical protein
MAAFTSLDGDSIADRVDAFEKRFLSGNGERHPDLATVARLYITPSGRHPTSALSKNGVRVVDVGDTAETEFHLWFCLVDKCYQCGGFGTKLKIDKTSTGRATDHLRVVH